MILGSPRYVSRLTALIVLAVFTALAGLRGMVGTDTWAYYSLLDHIARGFEVPLEPGFVYLGKVFTAITDSTTMAVNSFSFLFFAMVGVFALRATRAEAIYLFGFFAPQYFIMYSMNGLRIGLASIAFLLAIQSWKRKQPYLCLSLLGAAISFHFTITLAIFAFFFFIRSEIKIHFMIMRFLMIIFLFTTFILLQSYIFDQIEAYSDFSRFSALAGVSYLLKMFLFLLFLKSLPLPKGEILSKAFTSVFLILAGFLLATQSYAGLRFLDIFTWLIPLLFIYAIDDKDYIGRRFSFGLTVVGAAGGFGVLRNISNSTFLGQSPFLPYHFIWQMTQ